MAQTEYPRDWVRTLATETARWVREGLISEEQRTQITGLYPAEAGSSRDRTVLIISILGSLLVGAGVILFFAANWAAIPAAVKVASILFATVGAYGTGYYLEFVHGGYPRIGHSLIFLGTLFYGAGIWLIAQIFHLESRFPNGFLLWAIGILPMAWAAASVPMLYLSAALLGLWTVMEQTSFETYNSLFPILALGAVLPLARRLRSALVESGVLVGLFFWFVLNVGRLDFPGPATHEGLLIARPLLLYGVMILCFGLLRLGEERVYLAVGAVGSLIALYILTFNMESAAASAPGLLAGSLFLKAGLLLFLGATVAAGYLVARRREADRTPVLIGLLPLVVTALTVHLIPQIPRMITANALLLAGTIGLVIMGIQRRSELLINLGLAAFVGHLLTRYFDLFFDAMDKSVFFIVGGILLLGGGWLLERNRRRWIGEIGGESR